MKIVFIIKQLSNGGAEKEAIAFASELIKLGEEVHIVSIRGGKDDYAAKGQIHWHALKETSVHIPRIRGACNQFLMAVLLRKIRGDVVLPFYITFHLAVLLSGSRLIYAVRTNLEKELPSKSDKIRRELMGRFADGIWIQVPEQKYLFSKKLQGKIFEIPNILDNRFLQIRRVPREKIVRFISVGRLHPQKNQKMLIEAFGRMVQQTGNKTAELIIYGRICEGFSWIEKSLKDQIQLLGLQDRILLAGWAADIEKRYAEADVFVFSSNYEGCPNALMEAMAAGLPCISTNCQTGPSMLIENGKNGLLVPVGEVEEMSQAMKYLIENPQEAERLGEAAKQRMKKWGTAKGQAEKLLEKLRG